MKTLEDVLEEITPQPDPGFVADMERRMRAGFPPAPTTRRVPSWMALPTSLRPRAAAGLAATACLALIVGVALIGTSSGPREEKVVSAFDAAPERDAAAPAPEGAPAPVPSREPGAARDDRDALTSQDGGGGRRMAR